MPPWERFPEAERYSIGWRMGGGEQWWHEWRKYVAGLDSDFQTRLDYLRRHAPAPISWADVVHETLYPDTEWQGRHAPLVELGVIGSDVAFATWLAQNRCAEYPWEWPDTPTPEQAARYATREFWFWSRKLSALRAAPGWQAPPLPEAWQACAVALQTGDPGAVEARQGLLTLAQMLCAGQVQGPWQVGLTPADFEDFFDDDMGYVDAFQLWCLSAIDDDAQLRALLPEVPPEWETWLKEHVPVPEAR